MAGVREFLRRAAPVVVPVLLQGETGTGKSHLARLLHRKGPRRKGPFVTVNCAGIPDGLFEAEFFGHRRGAFTGASESRAGLFEQASGGTLFLDEVGELPLHQQAKLLAVLEDGRVRRVGGTRIREVDVRIVAATCRDLRTAVATGDFRTDLFHRLALLRCEIPPLRVRPGDLDGLVAHFLGDIGMRHGFPKPRLGKGALSLLRAHTWPGNVRELAHALEAAFILADGRAPDRALVAGVLRGRAPAVRASVPDDEPAAGSFAADGVGHSAGSAGTGGSAGASEAGTSEAGAGGAASIPAPGSRAAPLRAEGRRRYSFYGTPEEEREVIRQALARHRGNRTRAARELGMSRNTLRSRMRKYGI